MKRRTALRYIMIGGASAMVLPSCIGNKNTGINAITLRKISISEDQQRTVAKITEILLPDTDIPGAKSLNAYQFVLRMIDDCYAPEDQLLFSSGLATFEKSVLDKYNKTFSECTADECLNILTPFETNDMSVPVDAKCFYSIVRKHTIQSFLSSEVVMTKHEGYEYLPGRFNGCVSVAKSLS